LDTGSGLGTLRCVSRITRQNLSLGFEGKSSGSSWITVFIPTKIASILSLNFFPSFRDFSPVIHFDSPLNVAIFPSRLAAALITT